MARARNIKPGFFTNDVLCECSPLARLLFEGLWCHADRAGRLEERPKKFKAEILPYDDGADVDDFLDQLASRGFIVRYFSNGIKYIQVVNFSKHQNPHIKETTSTIPAPDEHSTSTVLAGKSEQPSTIRAGLIPDSLNPIKTKEAELPGIPDISDSVESAQNPKDLIFKQGVEILIRHGSSGDTARSFLGKWAKVSETQLAGVIGQLMAQPKIEPKAYIVAAMTPKKRGLVL